MKRVTLFLLVCMTCIYAHSQSVIDTIQAENLLIIGDPTVVGIVDNAEKSTCLTAEQNKNAAIKRSEYAAKVTEAKTKEIEAIKEKREVDVCYGRDKVDGIKIKVGITKTLEEANKLKREAMQRFPYITTPEVKDVRPHYYVLIGDYFSRNAAARDFSAVKKVYPNAVLTNWRVYCRKAIRNGK